MPCGGDELTVIVVRRPCLLATAKKAERGERREERARRKADRKAEAERDRSDWRTTRERGRVYCPSPLSSLPSPLNVVIAGLGGQGVLTASDILAEAALLAGFDVKKADVHGMSQRGGSVASDVRFGASVLSPMVPPGEADFLLVLAEDQVDNNRPRLREGGVLIAPDAIDPLRAAQPSQRERGVAWRVKPSPGHRRRRLAGGHPQTLEARTVRGQLPGVRARPR